MINRVKCPKCGESDGVSYAVNGFVYFTVNDDGTVNIDMDNLCGSIEEDTSMNDVFCKCKNCGHMFSGGDAECV